MLTRRSFLGTSSLAFLGLRSYTMAEPESRVNEILGALKPDPAGIIELPEGFSYRVLARVGQKMSDGFRTPGAPDGMAAFPAADGKLVLVCNHELDLTQTALGPFTDNTRLPADFDSTKTYDGGIDGKSPHLGGTSNIVFDPKEGKAIAHFLSLNGTDRNCAGGAMPWGSWITCEEPEDMTTERGLKHGWCFEVKATAQQGIQDPKPLKGLGRFRHEAVALGSSGEFLYLTEDREDGLLYRFVLETKGDLTRGKLQALVVDGKPSADLRNRKPNDGWPKEGEALKVLWMDLQDIESPKDDLRARGFRAGAARFARGEGIHLVGDSLFICCTSGGPSLRGQVFKLTPSSAGDTLELFIQPERSDLLTNGDNICAAPWGGIVICEDLIDPRLAPAAHVRCVTPDGKIFTIARNPHPGEFSGGCFSPDGKWFFVNIMGSGHTLAITGPWPGGGNG